MTPNNNLSILPWYNDPEKQNHRKDYAFGNIFPLVTPDRKLLPFQIIRATRVNEITEVALLNIDGIFIMDITVQMVEKHIQRFENDGYDLIIYPGILPMAIETPEGRYYARLSDGVETWYSEVFTIIRNLDNFLKIEYWDTASFELPNGQIDYTAPYKSIIYLDSQLGKPEYPFEEELEKRDGYSFIEKQISEKTYKFTFIAPEFICDAMRIIRMHDYIRVTNKGEIYDVDTFLITPKWLDQGDLASVEAEFQCGTVIKKIGKGLIQPQQTAAFNNDFNNDFNK